MKSVVPSSLTLSSGLSSIPLLLQPVPHSTKRLLQVLSRTSLTVNEQVPLSPETTATQTANSALGWL